ncbi:MAG TPA: sulfotransferase [Gemmatimonadaceae bacterium]|nr:sulfotransferase [Gemmatimonadaceae bacterium]
MPDRSPSRDPIFIVGTGRCGSTILYSLLAMHPDLAWIPSHLDLAPSVLLFAATARIWNLPGTDRYREARFLPKPVEPNRVFEHWVPEYYSEAADPRAVARGRATIVPLLERIRRYQGKPRFLGKLVGRPVKITLLRELFPGARFVHITRGLGATVSSLLRVDFYARTKARIDAWKWDAMPSPFVDYYRETGEAPEVAAAITIVLNRWQLARQLAQISADDRVEVAYQALVQDPVEAVRRIGERAGLEVDEAFRARIARRRVYGGADEQWRHHLSDKQQHNLLEFERLARDVQHGEIESPSR